jgi:hypothetical protein
LAAAVSEGSTEDWRFDGAIVAKVGYRPGANLCGVYRITGYE